MTKKNKKIAIIVAIVIAVIIASKFVPGVKNLWPAKDVEVKVVE